MTDDEKYMRLALAEADAAATEGEVPIGAVVVCGGQVVARAHNRRELDLDPSAHAEFSAMVAASRALGRWRLSGCTVYVTLEPCLMCAGLMVNARIDRCVFGASDPKGGALGTLYDVSHDPRLNHEFEVTPGRPRRRGRKPASRFLPCAPRSPQGRKGPSRRGGHHRPDGAAGLLAPTAPGSSRQLRPGGRGGGARFGGPT